MQFVNRKNIANPPLIKLKNLNDSYKKKWSIYNTARKHKVKSLPNRPPSSWLHEDIRIPLKTLFLKNCGYCGVHTDSGNDAEVDHHYPTSKDLKADHVFDWENYVWSCPSCNRMKRDNHPLLDPCLKSDMEFIYFHSADGRYLYLNQSPETIKSKFELTEKKTNLNSKNRPDHRKYVFRDTTEYHLKGLRISIDLYQLELGIHGEDSVEAQSKLESFNLKKIRFMDLIKSGNYLFLIKHAFESFYESYDFKFPFTFEELIVETNYLNSN